MQLNPKQKALYGEKILDLAHIATGALVFGQFVTDRPFSLAFALMGLSIFFGAYMVSYLITKQK